MSFGEEGACWTWFVDNEGDDKLWYQNIGGVDVQGQLGKEEGEWCLLAEGLAAFCDGWLLPSWGIK